MANQREMEQLYGAIAIVYKSFLESEPSESVATELCNELKEKFPQFQHIPNEVIRNVLRRIIIELTQELDNMYLRNV